MVFLGFPMVFPWFSHGFPIFLSFLSGFPMVFPWFSHFPIGFVWFSHGFPMVFPCSYRFCLVFPWFSEVFPIFPMVFRFSVAKFMPDLSYAVRKSEEDLGHREFPEGGPVQCRLAMNESFNGHVFRGKQGQNHRKT